MTADNEADLPVSYLEIVRYALPLMAIHASFFVYMQSDILILKYFRDIEEVSLLRAYNAISDPDTNPGLIFRRFSRSSDCICQKRIV